MKNQKEYDSLVVLYDTVKNLIKTYKFNKKAEQKRLKNIHINTLPPYSGDDLVSARIDEEITNIDIFIMDLKKIKNKIIELNNIDNETN
jgi:hypothetical protein